MPTERRLQNKGFEKRRNPFLLAKFKPQKIPPWFAEEMQKAVRSGKEPHAYKFSESLDRWREQERPTWVGKLVRTRYSKAYKATLERQKRRARNEDFFFENDSREIQRFREYALEPRFAWDFGSRVTQGLSKLLDVRKEDIVCIHGASERMMMHLGQHIRDMKAEHPVLVVEVRPAANKTAFFNVTVGDMNRLAQNGLDLPAMLPDEYLKYYKNHPYTHWIRGFTLEELRNYFRNYESIR